MSKTVNMDKVLEKRPPRVIEKLGERSKVCLLSSKDIFEVLKDRKSIIMTCNTRIKLVIPGIMQAAEDLDAIVGFELAKTEGDVDGGYTGQNPDTYFKSCVEYAEEIGLTKPFFIHGDHVTVKNTSDEEINAGKRLIAAELEAGYTSFALDASFNHIPDNIRITTELARPIIRAGYGLEVEVGEIKHLLAETVITTVEEAVEFITGLNSNGIHPSLLAINNGSKHGNYLAGEKVHIDLKRTGEIYEVIKEYGVRIAQHGITGTPLNVVGQFADYGIRKGNVGTEWQNIAHKGLPEALMNKLKAWADENKKDIKMATKPFKKEIDSVDKVYKDRIRVMAYESASAFIKALRAEGTAGMVLEALSR